MNHNPSLRPSADAKAGPEAIEDPAEVQNITWQTRPAPLTEHETRLARALTDIFGRDIWELAAVARALTEAGVPPEAGGAWTETSLAAELARLAA